MALDSVPDSRQLYSSMGVFVGLWNVEMVSKDSPSFHSATGRLPSVAAGRIAFALELEGPVATIDAACASSLVALAVAFETGGHALVAGVNAICGTASHESFHGSGMLSSDGRCKTFDEAADGYGRSEACIVFCVVRGSFQGHKVLSCSVTHGGKSAGLTAPSQSGQERAIRSALAKAGIQNVLQLESHGTGEGGCFFFCFEILLVKRKKKILKELGLATL